MRQNTIISMISALIIAVLLTGSAMAISMTPGTIEVKAQLGQPATAKILVSNEDTTDILNVQMSHTGLNGFIVSFSPSFFALPANSGREVGITLTPPGNADLQDYSGLITAGNSSLFTSNTIIASVNAMLSIENVDVKFGDTEVNNIREGEIISADAEPGMPLEFKVRLRNEFPTATSSDTGQLRNVFFRVTIVDLGDEGDIDLESEDFELPIQDAKSKTLYYTVPLMIEEGSYDVEVYAEGTDGDGIIHSEAWQLRLDLSKDAHDVRILNEGLSTAIVDCTRKTALAYDLVNVGSSDERQVFAKVENSELGIRQITGPFILDANLDSPINSIPQSFSLTIPQTAKPGKYRLDLRAYYLTNLVSSVKLVDLEVRKCSTAGPEDTGSGSQDSAGQEEPGSTAQENAQQGTQEEGLSEQFPGINLDDAAIADVVDTSAVPKENNGSLKSLVALAGLNIFILLVIIFVIYRLIAFVRK